MPSILIFGRGWFGNYFKKFYSEGLDTVYLTETRINDKLAVSIMLKEIKPDIVLNCAGKPSGSNNIDWCELHPKETFASNVLGPAILAQECHQRNIFLVHLSTGYVFNGEPPRSSGFIETDKPNATNFYSRTKIWGEQSVEEYNQAKALILRLNMPMDGTPAQRNFLTKLANCKYVANEINSVSAIPSFLMAANVLIRRRKTGIYHIANPEPISHIEILELYKEYVDSEHTCELVSKEELVSRGLLKASRSSCILDTSKLQSEGIGLFPTRDAIIMCLKKYALSVKNKIQ